MKVVIVGGVAGGAGAAARLRRNDEHAEIILLERGEHISFANCGLPYHIGDVIKKQGSLLLQTPQSFRSRFNIDVRVRHECLFVDIINKSVQVKNLNSGEIYTEKYDKLLLSPGARPIMPPLPGLESNRVFTLRNVPDTLAIKSHVETAAPKSCAVIGGGFIGLEMAENLKEKGLSVSIVEGASHVIGPLDVDMAHDIHNYIRSKGIALHLNSKAARILPNAIELEGGRQIDADMIIMSVGVAPETDFLSESGIVRGRRGEIIVNEYLETSAPDVYAVGDAISSKHFVSGKNAIVALASCANKQARIVADNICGLSRKYTGAQGTAIAKFFDMSIAVTGLSEAQLTANSMPWKKSITYSSSNAGYYPGGQMMSIKLLYAPGNGRILGAQITGGKGVDKRIDVIATAIRARMTIFDLQELELAYAPPFSSAKDPVNMAGFVAGNIMSGKTQPCYVEQLDSLRGHMLVDVRTPQEFSKGSIPGAINMPLDSLRSALRDLDKSRPLLVFCQIGLRGYIAEQMLRQYGFSVKNLAGGYRLYHAAISDS